MNDSESSSTLPRFFGSPALWRYFNALGFLAVALWFVWWGFALYDVFLFADAYTQIRMPMFGADFWSQSDYAARAFANDIDPYASRRHLFHYPPLVIRLFLWTPLFTMTTALRIWIAVLIVLLVLGTLAAASVRRRLPIGQIPTSLALAAVLFSFPVVFQLERANFDLITLAAILLALPLFRRGTSKAEFLAGCVLAVGPWVKLYPGIMGLGLVALRRWRAVAGFAVAGVLIGLLTPEETMRSFDILALAVKRVTFLSFYDDYYTWSHSISVAYLKLAKILAATPLGNLPLRIPIDWVGVGAVLAGAAWLSYRLYRLPGCDALLYPLLLWLNALGSCVGVIANDYSLVFLPLAAIAVHSFRDPWFVKLSMTLLVIWWQPFYLHVPAIPLLIIKFLGIAAVGVSLVRRARELSSGARVQEAVLPSTTDPLRATFSRSSARNSPCAEQNELHPRLAWVDGTERTPETDQRAFLPSFVGLAQPGPTKLASTQAVSGVSGAPNELSPVRSSFGACHDPSRSALANPLSTMHDATTESSSVLRSP